jgi:hypothetical protein
MGDEQPKIIKNSKFLSVSDKYVDVNIKGTNELMLSPREVTKIVVKTKGSSKNENFPDNDIEVIIEHSVTPRINKRKKSDNRLETDPNQIRPYRKDAYGSPIVKRGPKNYKVSFQDQINKNKLQEVVYIQSFKNIENEENENKVKHDQCCGRCEIF